MTLYKDVTFESLSAVKEELREWLGPEPAGAAHHNGKSKATGAARDALVSVLIHRLAEELSDVIVRSQIQALLAEMSKRNGKRFSD